MQVPIRGKRGDRPVTKTIFINLPVTDLARSMAFYEAVGFTNNPTRSSSCC